MTRIVDVELENKAEELRLELEKVEAEIARKKNQPEDQRLAEFIHERMCHQEHTERCGWFYEKRWTDWTHARYLEQAHKVMAVANYDQAVMVINALRND